MTVDRVGTALRAFAYPTLADFAQCILCAITSPHGLLGFFVTTGPPLLLIRAPLDNSIWTIGSEGTGKLSLPSFCRALNLRPSFATATRNFSAEIGLPRTVISASHAS